MSYNPLREPIEIDDPIESKIVDADGNAISLTGTESNHIPTMDFDLHSVLIDVLRELKKTNTYLSLMTDIHVKSDDVEV